MNLDATGVPENSIGSLNACLIEADPLQQRRAQNIRRRAIFFSVVFQTIAVAALLIFPLLGKGERIPVKTFVERPPYRFGTDRPSAGARRPTVHSSTTQPCFVCKSYPYTGKPIIRGATFIDEKLTEPPGLNLQPIGDPNGDRNAIETRNRPPSRPAPEHPVEQRRRIVLTHIDPARITRRVEPIYPILGIQLRHETRVELHAIISTDGSIQSLQIISGDPIFYQSALSAVSQWHYTPTLLNDQAVEVDTLITVIYTLNR